MVGLPEVDIQLENKGRPSKKNKIFKLKKCRKINELFQNLNILKEH